MVMIVIVAGVFVGIAGSRPGLRLGVQGLALAGIDDEQTFSIGLNLLRHAPFEGHARGEPDFGAAEIHGLFRGRGESVWIFAGAGEDFDRYVFAADGVDQSSLWWNGDEGSDFAGIKRLR